MSAPLHEAFDLLFAAFGPQRWWPGESPLEVLPLGARVRALVVGMDQGGRRLSLSTAEIEENDGDMLVDPERVYAGAD